MGDELHKLATTNTPAKDIDLKILKSIFGDQVETYTTNTKTTTNISALYQNREVLVATLVFAVFQTGIVDKIISKFYSNENTLSFSLLKIVIFSIIFFIVLNFKYFLK